MHLEHLPADVFPIDELRRRAVTGRPNGLKPLIIPARAADVPPPASAEAGARVGAADEAESRAELAATIEHGLTSFSPHVAALDAARALAEEATRCVVTRLEPALGGGPVSGLWRALHTIALARDLTREFGTSVVPVLWVDGDAPLASREFSWLNQDFDLVRVRMGGLTLTTHAASRLVLREEEHGLASLQAQVRQLLPIDGGEHADRWLPRDGETLSHACARAWSDALSALGACVVTTDTLREPLLRALAQLASAVSDSVSADCDETFALRIDEGPPQSMRWSQSAFRYEGEPGSRTGAELAAELLQDPDHFAPGAATRIPALASVLPIAVQVGGDRELRARVAALELEGLADRRVPFVPALCATWVDADCRASLEKLGLGLSELLRSRAEFPSAGPSSPVVERMLAIIDGTAADLLDCRSELAEIDRSLAQQLRRAAKEVRATVRKLADRTNRVVANRQGKGRRHERRLAGTLVPAGQPQESTLSLLQFASRHRRVDWEEILVELDPYPTEHLALYFD